MDAAKLADLRQRWTQLLAMLGCPPHAAAPTFADLHDHYTNPQRHYHTFDHIHAMLETVRECSPEAEPALLLAVWFHDVIYDSRAGDNEERSAAHARLLLQPLGVSDAILAETERLILLTKRHAAGATDRQGQLLIDVDLAILGAVPADYDAYAAAIRREYDWVADTDYRRGRCAVLERFLQRPRLYATDEMYRRFEDAARRNLQREIAELSNT
jgi:predicted metal-dependent HD superfamily phosphohydrolase